MSIPEKVEKTTSIRQIAAALVARKAAGQDGATVLLGAGASISSGIPGWASIAAEICRQFDIDLAERSATAAIVNHLNSHAYATRYALFRKYLIGKKPSRGYHHLAHLVKEGLISTILTTNWDTLVEQALLRFIPFDELKILIRDEASDDAIAEYLQWHRGHPIVLKLHGDLQARKFRLGDGETREFSHNLGAQIQDRLGSMAFIVGQSMEDVDVLASLISASRRHGELYHVRHESVPSEIDGVLKRSGAKTISGMHPGVLADVPINAGDFDEFFTQLNLAVELKLMEGRRGQLKKAAESILAKERTGAGYINYARITELVEFFTRQVKIVSPDLILFIEDRSAPGGMELKRRMAPFMRSRGMNARMDTIRIEGKEGSRTHERCVTSDLSHLPDENIKTILILDAITFSGNTLTMARRAIQERYPNANVRLGVLVISEQLKEKQDNLAQAQSAEKFLYEIATDRHEIFFPWGVTQTTSKFQRVFEGAMPEDRRHVTIAKRPWGTIEILVDEEISSVRFLTIEAGRKLSFQRHLCRDELYVALDDNIGLEICADDLARDADEYDEHVASLILEKGDYVFIPRGVWHRTKASMDRARILEVAFGLYSQDDDIERRWDDYRRERKDGSI